MFEIKIRVKRANLDGGPMMRSLADVVSATAFLIQQRAQANIIVVKAVDTGAMLNSAYTLTHASGFAPYQQALEVAQKRNPSASPARPAPLPDSPLKAVVSFGVEYATYIEHGYARPLKGGGVRVIPARPFLSPAVEQVRPIFHREVANVLQRRPKPA